MAVGTECEHSFDPYHVQTAAGSHVFELFVGTNVLFRMSQKVSRKHTDAEFVVIRKGASRTGSCTVMTGS